MTGSWRDRATARLSDLGYAAGWNVVRSLPAAVTRPVFTAAADVTRRRDGRSVRQLRRNLARVLGPDVGAADLDDAVAAAMRSYARYWLETFRLPGMDLADIVASLDVNAAHIDRFWAAVQRGKGVILALPHAGNWEASGVWLVARHGPFTTVAERLEPESLFDRFVAFRESLGFEVLALTGGESPPADVLAARLRAGGVVCLVADRDLSAKGIDVDFFGEPARMPAGPALLAATTGATLLAINAYFVGEQWGHDVRGPIEVPAEGRLRDRVTAGTQALADAFAAGIAEHPTDWHMLQRFWLADLAARPAPVRTSG